MAQKSTGFIILIIFILVLYGFKTSVGQLAEVFPEGLYRYAATAFIGGSVCIWFLMPFSPSASLFLLLLLLPLGARLSEYCLLEIGDVIVTIDVITIWITAIIAIGVHGIRRDMLAIYAGLFVILAVLSSMVNIDIFAPTIICCGILTPFLVYGVIVSVIRDIRSVKLIAKALGFAVVFCSFFAFSQPYIGGTVADYFYIRLPSIFYNPVIFANVIILLWPFTLIYEPVGANRMPALTFVLRAVGVAASFSALLLTGSRGALVVFVVQALWLRGKFLTGSKHKVRYARYSFYLIAVGLSVAAYANVDFLRDTLLRRFYNLDFFEQGNSAHERVMGVLGAFELGFTNPFFGVGLGNFKYAYPYTNAATSGMLELETAHNFILNLFAEIGLFGVAVWLLGLAGVLKRLNSVKKWLYAKRESSLYAVVKCSLLGYTATQFLFYGEFLHKNVGLPMIFYFVVLGVASTLYFIQKKEGAHV